MTPKEKIEAIKIMIEFLEDSVADITQDDFKGSPLDKDLDKIFVLLQGIINYEY